jgi:hypothetical protein
LTMFQMKPVVVTKSGLWVINMSFMYLLHLLVLADSPAS